MYPPSNAEQVNSLQLPFQTTLWGKHTYSTQVPGVTPTSGLSGGAYTLTLAQLGWNGTDILTFWRAIVNEGKTRLGSGVLGRLNALSVVSSSCLVWRG
jgi:hypothetical protein